MVTVVEDVERGVGLVAAVIILATCLVYHVTTVWLIVGPLVAGFVGYIATMLVDGSQMGRRTVSLF